MKLDGLKVGFAFTGSFCTIARVMIELNKIIQEGAEVFPIVSESVRSLDTRFGKVDEIMLNLEVLTGKQIISSIMEAEPIGPKEMLDIIVVAPCTGNTHPLITSSSLSYSTKVQFLSL
jgi:dipicolinate synthase subunit B